ncbi:ABC transporter substrate-binding protein [Paenibacillus sp. GCM10027628]
MPQAQFAGIFAAKEKGFYKDEGIDVEIMPGNRMSLSSSRL